MPKTQVLRRGDTTASLDLFALACRNIPPLLSPALPCNNTTYPYPLPPAQRTLLGSPPSRPSPRPGFGFTNQLLQFPVTLFFRTLVASYQVRARAVSASAAHKQRISSKCTPTLFTTWLPPSTSSLPRFCSSCRPGGPPRSRSRRPTCDTRSSSHFYCNRMLNPLPTTCLIVINV